MHAHQHPTLTAARSQTAQILVELAELQDAEVGDGTTSVVILAAELLKKANELVRNKIHPTNIISGYRLAMREVRGGVHSLFPTAAPVAAATYKLHSS